MTSEPKISKLIACSRCGNGCGKIIYRSSEIEGVYCCSDHYVEAMLEKLGVNYKAEEKVTRL